MSLNPSPKVNEIEPLIPILETQVIPWWERCSLDHLAITSPTLSGFKRQQVPVLMRTSAKMRVNKNAIFRGNRNFNNTNSFRKFWPEDDQAIYNYPAFIFVLEGEADFHIADYVVHCPQNHFLLFSDDVPRPKGSNAHFEEGNNRERHCAILWFFMPPGTGSVISYVCHSRGKEHWSDGYRIVSQEHVAATYTIFIQEIQEESPGYQPIAHSAFQTFLYLFLRELKEDRFLGGLNTTARMSPKPELLSPIERARQYVKTHLNQSLTATKVAHEVYMSRNSFIQHFTRETGQTFHDFVVNERMKEAHRLLSEGHWSIIFVCRFIGLKPSQFRTQFKARFGMTPSEFRKKAQING